MYKLNVLIAGCTGYIGVQLIKLLLKHKNVFIKYLCGNTSRGKSIAHFDKSLKNKNLPKIIIKSSKFQKVRYFSRIVIKNFQKKNKIFF